MDGRWRCADHVGSPTPLALGRFWRPFRHRQRSLRFGLRHLFARLHGLALTGSRGASPSHDFRREPVLVLRARATDHGRHPSSSCDHPKPATPPWPRVGRRAIFAPRTLFASASSTLCFYTGSLIEDGALVPVLHPVVIVRVRGTSPNYSPLPRAHSSNIDVATGLHGSPPSPAGWRPLTAYAARYKF
jgi:hypothetical protein